MAERQRTWSFATRGTEQAASAWRYAASHPSWMLRTAITIFLIILAIPLLALFFFALAAATLVFLILASLHAVLNVFRRLGTRGDGRENVRVIQRMDQP